MDSVMKKIVIAIFAAALALTATAKLPDYGKYRNTVRDYVGKDYKLMLREAGGAMPYPFMTGGSDSYPDCVWDWDAEYCGVAILQVLKDKQERENWMKYEKGCILNFLYYCNIDGWMPIAINRGDNVLGSKPADLFSINNHKPSLAQHAAFIVQQEGGDAEWLREDFCKLQYFQNAYRTRQFHRPTGLYFFVDDVMIGVDNDPCTFYRPMRSSASIYLNCMMYKEMQGMVYLADRLGLKQIKADYEKWAADLKASIQEHCWDERDGFYYSVDIDLLPRVDDRATYHQGAQREWDCLIQRIGVWSGFMAMWADIATPEQAERMVKEHYRNPATFNAPGGVRTLSKMEKMYNVKASGNPSSWLGPIWGIANYMTWRGLYKYGYTDDAKDLAAKTVVLFGSDIERCGAPHEYYEPDSCEPVLNKGFQSWNMLMINMLDWLDGKKTITEL